MFRKTMLPVVALSVMFVSNLFAQTADKAAPITGEPEETALINERIQFVKHFYSLQDDQLGKLKAEMESRVGAQEEYMRRNELVLRRRTTAISAVLPQDQKLDRDQLQALRSKYQEQIYRIRESAPLSLTNAVRMAEEMIAADARKAGREKIEGFFAKQLDGKPLDPARLDRLVLAPVPMLDIDQNEDIASQQDKLMGNTSAKRSAAENRPSPKEIQAAKEAAIKAKRLSEKQDPHAGHNHKPVPPAASERKIEVVAMEAPPLAKWESQYQQWATDYGFTPAQKASAESIFQHCMKQAEAKMTTVQPLLEKAKMQPEGAPRDKAIRLAMQPLDNVYTQMKARIDSVASIEQRERFEAQQKAAEKSAKASEDKKAP